MLIVFPTIIMILIIKKRKNMTDEDFEAKYGEFYTGLKVKIMGLSSLFYPFYFMLRRLILVLILIFGINVPWF